jgi:hypothetical protein
MSLPDTALIAAYEKAAAWRKSCIASIQAKTLSKDYEELRQKAVPIFRELMAFPNREPFFFDHITAYLNGPWNEEVHTTAFDYFIPPEIEAHSNPEVLLGNIPVGAGPAPAEAPKSKKKKRAAPEENAAAGPSGTPVTPIDNVEDRPKKPLPGARRSASSQQASTTSGRSSQRSESRPRVAADKGKQRARPVPAPEPTTPAPQETTGADGKGDVDMQDATPKATPVKKQPARARKGVATGAEDETKSSTGDGAGTGADEEDGQPPRKKATTPTSTQKAPEFTALATNPCGNCVKAEIPCMRRVSQTKACEWCYYQKVKCSTKGIASVAERLAGMAETFGEVRKWQENATTVMSDLHNDMKDIRELLTKNNSLMNGVAEEIENERRTVNVAINAFSLWYQIADTLDLTLPDTRRAVTEAVDGGRVLSALLRCADQGVFRPDNFRAPVAASASSAAPLSNIEFIGNTLRHATLRDAPDAEMEQSEEEESGSSPDADATGDVVMQPPTPGTGADDDAEGEEDEDEDDEDDVQPDSKGKGKAPQRGHGAQRGRGRGTKGIGGGSGTNNGGADGARRQLRSKTAKPAGPGPGATTNA